MKIISIDVETTGLNQTNCSVLEFGAAIFNPRPPKPGFAPKWETFECLIAHSWIQGEPWALQMNQEILAEIAGAKKTYRDILTVTEFITNFRGFCLDHREVNDEGGFDKYTVAGKNFDRLDFQFLKRIPGWTQRIEPLVERRTLDVGSLFFNPDDDKIVNLTQCLEKVGQSGLVTHRAVDDALAVATAVTRFFA